MKLFRKHPSAEQHNKYLTKQQLVALGVVALVGVIGIWLVVINRMPAQRIDASKYQVVYLANGQAYFGKLQNTNGQFLVITEPYTMQEVQAAPAEGDTTKPETNTTLIRVSGQVYGPEESIALRSDQVTFWQNLRDDSKVSQAIKSKE